MNKIIMVAIVGATFLTGSVSSAASDATHIVAAEARRQGVPVDFALMMARVESGVKCGVHSKHSTASGPLQITAPTARSLGYRGNIRNSSCFTQVHYGIKHLSVCYRGAHGNRALAKRCHQSGVSVLYRKKKSRR